MWTRVLGLSCYLNCSSLLSKTKEINLGIKEHCAVSLSHVILALSPCSTPLPPDLPRVPGCILKPSPCQSPFEAPLKKHLYLVLLMNLVQALIVAPTLDTGLFIIYLIDHSLVLC